MLKAEDITPIKLTRKSVTSFNGAGSSSSKDPGVLVNSRNVFCQGGAVLSASGRLKLRDVQSGAAIGSDGTLYWVENRRLYYGGYPVDGLYLSDGEKKLVSLGGYLLIFPDGVYVSESDTSDFGNMHASLSCSGTLEVKNCLLDLTPISGFSVLESEPENASAGDFRAISSDNGYKMLRYDGYSWREISTLVRLTFPGCGGVFHSGDVVEVNGMDEICGKLFKISHITGDYVYFDGCTVKTGVSGVTITRYIPIMDYVTVSGGRLCGCRYGNDRSGTFVRRFYASASCDPFDFCSVSPGGGVSADVPGSGEFLGISDYSGSCVLFYDGGISEITVGASRITFLDTVCAGIESGAEKSIAQVGDAVYYKGSSGIFAYRGSQPKLISEELGIPVVSSEGSPGVGFRGKYYVSVRLSDGDAVLCYDPASRLWSIYDDPGVSGFAVRRNVLYALVKGECDSIVIMDTSGVSDDALDYCSDGVSRGITALAWRFESGMLCADDLKGIYPEFLTVRIGKCTGNVEIGLNCDFEELPSETVRIPSASGVYTFPVKKRRCDTVRASFSGDGEFSLLGIMLGYTQESEGRSWS